MFAGMRGRSLGFRGMLDEALTRSLIRSLLLSAVVGLCSLVSGLTLNALGHVELELAVSLALLSMLGSGVLVFIGLTPVILARSWERVLRSEGLLGRCDLGEWEERESDRWALGGTVMMVVLGFPMAAIALCLQI